MYHRILATLCLLAIVVLTVGCATAKFATRAPETPAPDVGAITIPVDYKFIKGQAIGIRDPNTDPARYGVFKVGNLDRSKTSAYGTLTWEDGEVLTDYEMKVSYFTAEPPRYELYNARLLKVNLGGE